jgi:hypothetical protein
MGSSAIRSASDSYSSITPLPFKTSKAPQFKGKSKKKKNKMAVAAYLSAKDKIKEVVLAKMKQK